jgi:hypothetical protein
MKQSIFLLSIILLSFCAAAQDTTKVNHEFTITDKPDEPKSAQAEFNVSFNSYASTGRALPFWFTSNQNGAFTSENGYYQLLRAGFARGLIADSTKKWNFNYGTSIIAGMGSKTDFQFNQYWIGAQYKWLVVKIGAKNDSVRFAGLSHTNGNMIWSGNARPLPGITFSTNGFVPLFSQNKWFTVKALYEENFLSDKRDMKNAMLHHKYLYGRATLNKWKFTLGIDHWVYWGGTSRTLGSTPGIASYLRYIFALKGGANASGSDQANAAGNSIGMYVAEVEKNIGGNTLTFYWNHPYEDRSGLELANMPDGVWGLHYGNKNRGAFLTDFVYEFMSTLNQSGTYHLQPSGVPGVLTGRGRDNYFALGIGSGPGFYSSGHVHYNKMMGTPLFVPVIGADGISKGFDNTRIEMHHVGIGGTLADRLTWRSLMTWSRSFGTYETPYPEPISQFSCLGELNYRLKKIPLRINMGMAADYGKRFRKCIGATTGISWSF